MSPRIGILLSLEDLLFAMRPPMTTVCPSGVMTTVLAERMLMFGAYTGEEPEQAAAVGDHLPRRRGVQLRGLGLENHLHQPVVPDERRDVQDDADVLVGAVDGWNSLAAGADRGIGHAAGQINFLADDNLRGLAVARENGRARQHLRFAGGGDGLKSRRKIIAKNLINAAGPGCPCQCRWQAKVVVCQNTLADWANTGGNKGIARRAAID